MFSVGFMLQFTAGVDFNGTFYATMYYIMFFCYKSYFYEEYFNDCVPVLMHCTPVRQ